MPYVIKDTACVEVCQVDCIYERLNKLLIHPDKCIDGGACEPVGPVKAIFAEDEMQRSARGGGEERAAHAQCCPITRSAAPL